MLRPQLNQTFEARNVLTLLMATLALATFAFVPKLAAASAMPQSCAEVKQQDSAATDGEYTLNLQGHMAHIYCADMTGTPKEYITLARTGANYNYAFFYGNHKNHYYQYWWVYGTNAITNYNKIRIDPVTLVVDQNDQKFAVFTSTGKNGYDSSDPNFNPVPASVAYATGGDCAASWSAQGKANVDLTGTDFALDDTTTFGWGGFAANGSVSIDPGRQIVNMTGGGWCGGVGPQGALKLKLLTPLVPTDTVAPVTTASAPTGWQKQDVTVRLSATDDESGVEATLWQLDGDPAQQGTTVLVNTDGTHPLSFWSVDNAGNAETPKAITIEVDKTAPSISGSASTSGWTNQPVTVTFVCEDATSGVQSCQAPVTVTAEGKEQSVTGTAADNAGNTASATVNGINIDLTAPTFTFTGNAGSYMADQQVYITCAATDTQSGVASTTCQTISGPAYNFAVGSNTFSASATDKAGNTSTATTSFAVGVSYDAICALTQKFVTKDGVAHALCAKLDAAKASAARGNANSKAGQIGAFISEVQAQSGKALTPEQAAILTRLAQAL